MAGIDCLMMNHIGECLAYLSVMSHSVKAHRRHLINTDRLPPVFSCGIVTPGGFLWISVSVSLKSNL